ncbi:unnamed protein product [Ceutorhynchus assimilis]|uniref:Uncharacterized protein n=1 Tax=Ceutorhynchus assimilis TaxID=467358 RepID=A0A9N9MNY0_9CUCU|nr:unnamed protein product [Ceutorhynchus assimilis]
MPFMSSLMSSDKQFKDKVLALESQIQQLKAAINTLNQDRDKKEVAIASLAREKAEVTIELLKQRKSNQTLLKQLEDERKFYFKEKEIYCQEINQFKKLKQALSDTTQNHPLVNEAAVEPYKKETEKIKGTLNKVLEANYNIGIKFLRMKNTNSSLKDELKSIKLDHKKCSNDYKIKIDQLTDKLNELLVQDHLNTPSSSSNKKYLHLVKQNSCLVHENLNLQLQVDNLNSKCQKLNLEKTNSRLTNYIKHENPKRVRKTGTNEASRSAAPSTLTNQEEILKLFDCHNLPGVSDVSDYNSSKSTQKSLGKVSGKKRFQATGNSSLGSVTSRNLVRVNSSPELSKANSF